MDSLFDRLGLYDFFNVIVAGGIVLFFSLEVDNFVVDRCSRYFGERWLFEAAIVGMAYILGIFCQEIGRFLTEKRLKIKSRQVEHFLDERADVEKCLRDKVKNDRMRKFLTDKLHIINNDCNVRVYQKYANAILARAEEQKYPLDAERIQFVYAHCIYYIQNQGKAQKVEKMRALYGMAQNLVGAGIVVLLTSIFLGMFHVGSAREDYFTVTTIGALVLIVVAFDRVFEYSKLTIRMTMGAYEACLENFNEQNTK